MKNLKTKNRKKNSKSNSKENPTTTFKRVLHAARELRYGVGRARLSTDPVHLPAVVRQLGCQQTYKQLFAPVTFPKSLKDYSSRRRIPKITAAGEMIWTASVLALFSSELKVFVKLKAKFHSEFFNGNLDSAAEILDKIQSNFGFSLWLIHSKLNLLQNAKGLKAQKDFLEEVLSAGSPNQIVTWVSYYLSLQAEASVSFADFSDEVSHIIGTGELSDYILRKLLPIESTKITDPSTAISWDEPHCIIDRFETLVAMSILYYSRNGISANNEILVTFSQIENIGDIRVTRTLQIARDEYIPDEFNFLAWADLYTTGQYQSVINGDCEILELIARSHACANEAKVEIKPGSIKQNIIRLMYQNLILDTDKTQTEKALKKIALACAGHHYANQIGAFLHRSHDVLFTDPLTELQNINALTGPSDNPWSTPVFDKLSINGRFSLLKEQHPQSPALILRDVLIGGDVEPLRNCPGIPSYRRAAYEGHASMATSDFASAIICYRDMANSNVKYIANSARIYLFDAYMAMRDFESAMHLVIDHCIESPSAARAYQLERLVNTCISEPKLQESIGLAILIFIATKNGIGKFERDLSDTYENALSALEISRPTELVRLISDENHSHYIYFLRNICVPRIMDDTTLFETLDEIDSERILICQELLQLDPLNEQSYLSEIRIITRDNNVAKLLEQVQNSKVFVDEDGIKQVLETGLSSSFGRYKELLSSPTLAYQAEKLSKILMEMINSTSNTDIRSLKLPATELEGLFRSMLMECVYQFAFNPAYGLDTHVSTTIRHGSFEGHLRSPLAVEDLLCVRTPTEHILPESWRNKLKDWDEGEINRLTKALGKFTQSFEDLVVSYLKEKLHMKTHDLPQGMFSFDSASRMSGKVMDSITINTDFDTLCDRLISYCWDLTELSLKNIRNDLKYTLTAQMTSNFESLLQAIEFDTSRLRVAPLIDSIVRAKTAFQVAVADVSEWFRRPSNLARDPFDLELAVHVAMQQVKNCYVKTPIEPTLEIDVPFKIDGSLLDGLCEIFFILLQNVIIHGGVQNQSVPVSLKARIENSSIIIECSNKLSNLLSIEERRNTANQAMSSYERDSALRRARNEGGSGLSKVWRIAEFDLRTDHGLVLIVQDDGTFTTNLTMTPR